MAEIKEEEFRNVDFNFWKVYDEIARNREVIYKNLFDVTNSQIQGNLKTIYEKAGVFMEIKPSDERCVQLMDTLMKEVAKIIKDYIPLKKIYTLDSESDKVEKIGKEVENATRQIKVLIGEILNSLIEDRRKHLVVTCSKFNGINGEFKDYTKVRIWSAKTPNQ